MRSTAHDPLLPAYLMLCGPILARLVFSNEKACLSTAFRISGTVLSWIKSYISSCSLTLPIHLISTPSPMVFLKVLFLVPSVHSLQHLHTQQTHFLIPWSITILMMIMHNSSHIFSLTPFQMHLISVDINHHRDIASWTDCQPAMPKPFKNRIPHYWPMPAISQTAYPSDISPADLTSPMSYSYRGIVFHKNLNYIILLF